MVAAHQADKADLAEVEQVFREDVIITMLAHNAGIGANRPKLDTDVNQLDDLISLNVMALTRFIYAAAPAFVSRVKRCRGLIVYRGQNEGDQDKFVIRAPSSVMSLFRRWMTIATAMAVPSTPPT